MWELNYTFCSRNYRWLKLWDMLILYGEKARHSFTFVNSSKKISLFLHSPQNNLRRVQNKLIFRVLSGFILNFLLLLKLLDWIIYTITIFRIKRSAPDGDISIFHKR